MNTKFYQVVKALVIFLAAVPSVCLADSAGVLPKGIFSFDMTHWEYFPITKQYDPKGKPEDLAVNYNGALDSTIFPALAPLDPFVPGLPTVGDSVVKFKLIAKNTDLNFYYGLTDNLLLGVKVPVNYVQRQVKRRLDTSTANVGKNAAALCGSLICPLFVPGTVPLTTQDVLDLVGQGLDVDKNGTIDIPGFGYKPFETYTRTGVGDIEVAGKYQFYDSKPLRFALSGGVRLPTGRADDRDSLTDFALGGGQTDLMFRLHSDYTGIENLLLNATVGYDVQLPDKEKVRVPDDANRPITVNRERVHRNLGDVISLDLMGRYSFTPEFSFGLRYRYDKKLKDSVDGDRGFRYSALEDETRTVSHMAIVSLGFSTVNLYLAKKFFMPFTADISYRNRFAGKSNVTKSEYVALNLTFFLDAR